MISSECKSSVLQDPDPSIDTQIKLENIIIYHLHITSFSFKISIIQLLTILKLLFNFTFLIIIYTNILHLMGFWGFGVLGYDTRAQSIERPDASRAGPLLDIMEIWIDRSLRRTAHVIQGGFGDDRGGDLDCQR